MQLLSHSHLLDRPNSGISSVVLLTLIALLLTQLHFTFFGSQLFEIFFVREIYRQLKQAITLCFKQSSPVLSFCHFLKAVIFTLSIHLSIAFYIPSLSKQTISVPQLHHDVVRSLSLSLVNSSVLSYQRDHLCR